MNRQTKAQSPDLENQPHVNGSQNGKGNKQHSLEPAYVSKQRFLTPAGTKALTYGLLNVVSASGIVFANKYVFVNCHFKFPYMLTWVHTLFTLVGMAGCHRAGMFEAKKLPMLKLLPIAAAYVAYIVFGNLSLNVNPVGFYQVMKIAVAPTVIALELLMFGTLPNKQVLLSVFVVCIGIAVATVTDSQLISNLWGVAIGMAATLTTALYQIWAGSKQKELKASSMQLLHAYTPHASIMLGLLVPLLEPVGWRSADTGTLLGYEWTIGKLTAVLISSVLGVLVSLSTFLFIGATSSLTYNVVGHMKTVIILTGGCLFFGDTMPLKKFTGVCIAMLGIIWYTHLKVAKPAAGGKSPRQSESPLPIMNPLKNSTSTSSRLTSRPAVTANGELRLANNASALNR